MNGRLCIFSCHVNLRLASATQVVNSIVLMRLWMTVSDWKFTMSTEDTVLTLTSMAPDLAFTDTDINQTAQPETGFSISPPSTIWGLSVNTVSYIFLATGGIAPLIFIFVVVATMKCYSRRRLQQLQKQTERYKRSQELWDMEKRAYLQSKQQQQSRSRVPVTELVYDNGPHNHHSGNQGGQLQLQLHPMTNLPDGRGLPKNDLQNSRQLLPSSHNPNVYFRETLPRPPPVSRSSQFVPTISPERSSTSDVITPVTETQDFSPVSDTVSMDPTASRNRDSVRTQQSITSEEARVLAVFDKIYEDHEVEGAVIINSSQGQTDSLPSLNHDLYNSLPDRDAQPESVGVTVEHWSPNGQPGDSSPMANISVVHITYPEQSNSLNSGSEQSSSSVLNNGYPEQSHSHASNNGSLEQSSNSLNRYHVELSVASLSEKHTYHAQRPRNHSEQSRDDPSVYAAGRVVENRETFVNSAYQSDWQILAIFICLVCKTSPLQTWIS